MELSGFRNPVGQQGIGLFIARIGAAANEPVQFGQHQNMGGAVIAQVYSCLFKTGYQVLAGLERMIRQGLFDDIPGLGHECGRQFQVFMP